MGCTRVLLTPAKDIGGWPWANESSLGQHILGSPGPDQFNIRLLGNIGPYLAID